VSENHDGAHQIPKSQRPPLRPPALLWVVGNPCGAQPGGFAEGADFGPIAGVSIEQFVSVSKGVAAFGYDPAKLPEIAASKGISAADWQTAHQGWNERIRRNRAVAQRLNQLYRAA
jgi:hypothetical protein